MTGIEIIIIIVVALALLGIFSGGRNASRELRQHSDYLEQQRPKEKP